jgi:hypothetical protein
VAAYAFASEFELALARRAGPTPLLVLAFSPATLVEQAANGRS